MLKLAYWHVLNAICRLRLPNWAWADRLQEWAYFRSEGLAIFCAGHDTRKLLQRLYFKTETFVDGWTGGAVPTADDVSALFDVMNDIEEANDDSTMRYARLAEMGIKVIPARASR